MHVLSPADAKNIEPQKYEMGIKVAICSVCSGGNVRKCWCLVIGYGYSRWQGVSAMVGLGME